jgi:hypothetical protein
MIANNGYGKYVPIRKNINLDANQEGNDSYMSANNADGSNEETQLQKHNEGISIRKEREEEGGQVLGKEEVVRLRNRRIAVFDMQHSK